MTAMLSRAILALLLPLATPAFAGALPSGMKETVAPVARAVTPAVVNIATRKVEQLEVPGLGDPMLQELFALPGRRLRRETDSAGSGVIVDADHGYVLTNEHVVRGASVIEVTTKDGRGFRARLVGRDRATDIAVLQIKADNLTAAPMGDSASLEVGDFVLAIGNPFGLGQTVTSGIVSALGRTGLGIEGYEDFIQTDASINPGNSGGALITLDGRLVGINTAILSKTGASNGIGFAIPIDMARRVMQQILAHGEVKRGRIGVTLREPGNKGQKGAEISAVEPASPADVAGLERGDIIVAVDGKPVETPAQLRNLVGLLPVGCEIGVRFIRDGDFGETSVRIEAQREVAERR